MSGFSFSFVCSLQPGHFGEYLGSVSDAVREGPMAFSFGETFSHRIRLIVGMLKPISASKWDFHRAAHLLNRAGFGGTPEEIDELVRMGPESAVDRLVDWERIPEDFPKPLWAKPDPDAATWMETMQKADAEKRKTIQQERRREYRIQGIELQQWWLNRMAKTRRPLQEKLTLFWHGHFATSLQKVKMPYLMWRQNEVFRRHGGGNWWNLVDQVTRDPAMLIWLDQARSRPDHPNENYARELMELFTLGEGHFSERDVLEAARALTGLTLDRGRQEPVFRLRLHDEGEKTILGKTARFGVETFLRHLVDQPTADRFITARLWSFFCTDSLTNDLEGALAAEFRKTGRRFQPFLRTLFLSEEFYGPGAVRQQIKSPVQLLVAATRQLEREVLPTPISNNALRLLGQELFMPPNVKGWDGGVAWINTNTLVNRQNLALLLVTGENPLPAAARAAKAKSGKRGGQMLQRQRLGAVRAGRLLPEADRKDPERLIACLEKRLLQGSFSSTERTTLRKHLERLGAVDDSEVLGLLRLALSTPDYQLC